MDSNEQIQWLGRDEFVRRFADRQADAGLKAELAGLASDLTDDSAPDLGCC